jgi:hypothetical protein
VSVCSAKYPKGMCRITLSSVACLNATYFRHYLVNRTIFGKELLNMKCVF